MTQTIQIGGLDASSHRLRDVALPLLDDLRIVGRMNDAMMAADSQRRIVAVVARKGNGKTMALQQALKSFRESERTKKDQAAEYEKRDAIRVMSPRDDDPLDVIGAIWKAALGFDMDRMKRGRKRSYEEVRGELVQTLLNQNISVLAFDEAEKLSLEALDVIRDVVSDAETESQDRYGGQRGEYQAAGIGVVLSGTWRLKQRLEVWEEARQRTLQVHEVPSLPPEEASRVYRAYLPAFDEAAQDEDVEWKQLIRSHVAAAGRVTLREIENHTRTYIRRMFLNNPEMTHREEVPWNEDLFLASLQELAFRPSGTDG